MDRLGYPDENRRRALIQRGTSAEFNITHGKQIARELGKVIKDEIFLANTKPELFSLPNNAIADLPNFDEDINSLVSAAWKDFHERYKDPARFMNIIANSKENPHTWLKFDANLVFYKNNEWNCFTIYLDNFHIPINILSRGTIIPKRELLSQKDFEELVLALTEAFGGEQDKSEENARNSLKRYHEAIIINEGMALNLLVKKPEQFIQFFKKDKMVITEPSRLMTDDEIEKWIRMLKEVMTSPEKSVTVGVPGFGSYMKYESLFQFGLGLSLKATALDKNANEVAIYAQHVPVQIREGDKKLGWIIAKVSHFPNYGKVHVSLNHGADEIYWYKMRHVTKA